MYLYMYTTYFNKNNERKMSINMRGSEEENMGEFGGREHERHWKEGRAGVSNIFYFYN